MRSEGGRARVEVRGAGGGKRGGEVVFSVFEETGATGTPTLVLECTAGIFFKAFFRAFIPFHAPAFAIRFSLPYQDYAYE